MSGPFGVSTRRALAVVTVAALAALLVVGTVAGPAAARDGAAYVYVEPRDLDADPGETITVDLVLSDHGDRYGNGVESFALTLAYDDPLVLESVERDPWLADAEGIDAADVDASVDRDPEAGTVTVEESAANPGDGLSQTETVATLTFSIPEDASPSTADLTVEDATVDLAGDWPQAVADLTGTVVVDGGGADDGASDPDGVTLGEDADPESGEDGGTDGDTGPGGGATDGGSAGADGDDGGAGAESIPGFGPIAGVGALAALASIAAVGVRRAHR